MNLKDTQIEANAYTRFDNKEEAVEIGECENGLPEELKDVDADFPDGGLRAWLVVFGAFCSIFSSAGFVSSWGVFQAYYQDNTLSHLSVSKIALIGSFQSFTNLSCSVFIGRLFDIGYFRIPLLLSSCIIVIGTVLIGECKVYWQVFLCQAIAIGLASGTMFAPPLAVVSHWFKKRRSTALSITISASSVGGAVLPFMIRELTAKMGFKWAMRILGLLFLSTTSCTNIFMKRRLPPTRVAGGFFNLKAFKFPPFSTYIIAICTCVPGLLVFLVYVDASASAADVPPSLSVYFLVIANGVGSVGRITGGILADRIGALTVMIPWTFIAGISTYAWPLAKSVPSLTAISIIYGFCQGVILGLAPVPLIHMGETADVGRRSGMLYSIMGLGVLAATPISGVIINKSENYQGAGIFGGTMIMVSVFLLWVTRYLMTGGLFKGKF